MSLKAGMPLFAQSAAPAMWVILAGEVSLESPDGARAANVVGAIATMAGRQLGISATVARNGAALKLDRDDLFGLLGERPELLRQMVSVMFKADAAQRSTF